MSDDERAFTFADMDRFKEDEWRPFVHRFEAHMDNDTVQFERLTNLVRSVHETIRVSAAVQSAVAKTNGELRDSVDRVRHSRWTKMGLGMAAASPLVGLAGIVVAILVATRAI